MVKSLESTLLVLNFAVFIFAIWTKSTLQTLKTCQKTLKKTFRGSSFRLTYNALLQQQLFIFVWQTQFILKINIIPLSVVVVLWLVRSPLKRSIPGSTPPAAIFFSCRF